MIETILISGCRIVCHIVCTFLILRSSTLSDSWCRLFYIQCVLTFSKAVTVNDCCTTEYKLTSQLLSKKLLTFTLHCAFRSAELVFGLLAPVTSSSRF